jgi:glucosamine--fructose-6-phosphate aminotransferase (isomerizing)
MADLVPGLLLDDVLETPAALRRLAGAHEGTDALAAGAARVLFLGMGSSRYAALTAVAELRRRGRDAHAEYPSTGAPQPPAPDLLAIAISAGGGSAETLAAIRRHRGTSRTLGITNRPGSALAREVDSCLDLHAGEERSGVACRSYTNTLALLLLLCGAPGETLRRAADACADLLDARAGWLAEAADLLERGPVHVLAPAERIGSAEQSALMLREVPRVRADACETGDWSHVDVYLSKAPGLGILVLRGSAWERDVMDWAERRRCPVVTVGGPLPGAALDIRVPGGDDPAVRCLVEGRVAELIAAELHARHGDRLSM